MPTATITSKGQVTIPKAVRDRLHLESGDRLRFRVRDDDVIEVEPETVDLSALAGSVRGRVKGVTLAAMEEAIRSRAGK